MILVSGVKHLLCRAPGPDLTHTPSFSTLIVSGCWLSLESLDHFDTWQTNTTFNMTFTYRDKVESGKWHLRLNRISSCNLNTHSQSFGNTKALGTLGQQVELAALSPYTACNAYDMLCKQFLCLRCISDASLEHLWWISGVSLTYLRRSSDSCCISN